jgi:chaperonin cofactor prefoldin
MTDDSAQDDEAFNLALSILAPAGEKRGLRMLKKAFEAIQDRVELVDRQNEELRAELARLKQEQRAAAAKAAKITEPAP